LAGKAGSGDFFCPICDQPQLFVADSDGALGAIALNAPAESFEPFEEGFKGWLDF
jgi:hypothetical protein